MGSAIIIGIVTPGNPPPAPTHGASQIVATVPMIALAISRLMVQAFSSISDSGFRFISQFYADRRLAGK